MLQTFLFVEVIPLLTRLSFCKNNAAAFLKIPEVMVILANPRLEAGKGCFHCPCFKPPFFPFCV
jgi:hypothetical protein